MWEGWGWSRGHGWGVRRIRDIRGTLFCFPDAKSTGAMLCRNCAYCIQVAPFEVNGITCLLPGLIKISACSFPVHPLLKKLIYADWLQPDKLFSPPKKFDILYPMEEEFTKKWSLPAVDASISCVNKNLTCPVDSIQVFKDPSEKELGSLLKSSFCPVQLPNLL